MANVEIFTPTGVLAGVVAAVPLTGEGADLTEPLALGAARWYPLDGSRPAHRGDLSIDPDDILLMVTPEPDLKVHMAWYSIAVDIGPYRVSGRLPTHPGFDPARALVRPGGSFIALSEATIELLGRDAAATAERAYVHVNRYAVDRVASTLMLGHYFPGANLVGQEPTLAAG